mmetsp:Transcript_9454/g.33262  ORF Transcript_9454/g.33262 Transcript_9454/m.33262 type:complete len:434 (+) Transcript_9454:909-2210(+)
MRSTMTSLPNVARYSAAIWNTRVTSSGWSALTWKMGISKALPTSLQYCDERLWCGSVVKPIWLLQTTWMVPPVLYDSSAAMCSVSYTMPWPANAASPCSSRPMVLVPPVSPLMSAFARTLPTTTGFTASKWLGFASSDRCTFCPLGYVRSKDVPRWYLTSPEPLQSPVSSSAAVSAAWMPWNSRKMSSLGLRMTLDSMLRRPRCGMPITTSLQPCSTLVSMVALMPAMSESQPSRPNRLAAEYFCARKRSKWSENATRSKICAFSSLVYGVGLTSMRSRSQLHVSRSWMCMYSHPILSQYALRNDLSRSPSFARRAVPRNPAMPSKPARLNSRSMSAAVKPYSSGSSSLGPFDAARRSGSSSAASCPRTWNARMRWSRRADTPVVSAPAVPAAGEGPAVDVTPGCRSGGGVYAAPGAAPASTLRKKTPQLACT